MRGRCGPFDHACRLFVNATYLTRLAGYGASEDPCSTPGDSAVRASETGPQTTTRSANMTRIQFTHDAENVISMGPSSWNMEHLIATRVENTGDEAGTL